MAEVSPFYPQQVADASKKEVSRNEQMEKDLLMTILSRLDGISDRLTNLSIQVGKVEERISSLEENLEVHKAEGTILRERQSEADLRVGEIAVALREIKNRVEEQGQEIFQLKRSFQEMREQIYPLLNLSRGFETVFRVITYSSAFILFALLVYTIVSEDSFLRTLISRFLYPGWVPR